MSALRRLALVLLVFAIAPPTPIAAQLSLPPHYVRRQLSPPGEPGSSVRFLWRIDPRGEWVVFVGDVENAGAEAVYAVRRNGTRLHRLSAYGTVGSIVELELSGDGRRVIYRGDLNVTGRDELWSAPLPGTPADAVQLNVAVNGVGVRDFALGTSGSRLAYVADTASGPGMWSVPIAGPAAANVRLDPPALPNEIPSGLTLTADGERAILALVDLSQLTSRVWSAPVAGPPGTGVFLLEEGASSCYTPGGRVSPSTGRFVYFLACPTANGTRFNQVWSVPVAGPASSAQSLAGSFVAGGEIEEFGLSQDGGRLIFLADKSVDDRFELWSVDVGGTVSSLVRLNGALVSGGDVVDFAIAPDGSRVAYVADQTTNEVFHAWSVPIDGPSTDGVPLVSGFVAFGSDVTSLQFSRDSSTIVYRADLSENDRFDLYSVPADGSDTQERITNDSSIPTPPRSTGTLYAFHPDGRRVVFTVDESAPGDQRRLYEQRFAPRYVQDARLNGTPVAGGKVSALEVYPDSLGTLYYSNEVAVGSWHLFTVDARIFGDGFEEGTTAAWGDLP